MGNEGYQERKKSGMGREKEERRRQGDWEEEIRDRCVEGLSRYIYFLKAFTVSGKKRLIGWAIIRSG